MYTTLTENIFLHVLYFVIRNLHEKKDGQNEKNSGSISSLMLFDFHNVFEEIVSNWENL